MQRRDFLLLSAAVTLALPLAARAATADYTPDLLKSELAAGKTVLLDFYAPWCLTCRAQHRAMERLRAENPAYDQNISTLVVDWDTYSKSDLVRELNIPRRSTLVVLKGGKELGRIVADTARDNIKALMDVALQAALA